MTSRERVKRAIHFQGVDHIPHHLPDGKENDILWLWMPRVPDPQPWTAGADGLERRIDAYGVTWVRPVGEHNHGEKWNLPIQDITRQADHVLPDQNNPAFFEGARQGIIANNAAINPKYCLGVMPFSSLNEGTHNLMGLDHMFLAYYEEPDHLKALIARLAEAQRESIRRLHAIGCDGVMGYDDWGLQDRLMVRVEMIEEFFMPHYVENWKLAHDLGMDVWMHSCGYIVPLLPKLHEWGLNVIQQDQQENQGLEALDAAVGGKLAFWCPVDVQKTMVDGTVDDIRAYVKRMVATLGSHNGGLCSMAYSQPEAVGHAPEKTAAMCAAFRELGVYPPGVASHASLSRTASRPIKIKGVLPNIQHSTPMKPNAEQPEFLTIRDVEGSYTIPYIRSDRGGDTGEGVGTMIAALGDSITEGYWGERCWRDSLELTADMFPPESVSRDGRNFPQYAPTAKTHAPDSNCFTSWMPRLNDILSAQWQRPVFIANEGWGGISTAGYLKMMREDADWQERMHLLDPGIWLIHLGVNDERARIPVVEVVPNLNAMIDILIGQYDAVPAHIVLALPCYDYAPGAADILAAYRVEMEKIITDRGLRQGPDFFSAYATEKARWYGDDPVHPNPAGMARMAELWAAALADLKRHHQ